MNHSYHRRKLFAKFLEPSGFELHNGVYIRTQGNQRHAMDYQTERAGGAFTINLGFDYDFVPSWNSFKYEDVSQLRLTRFNLRIRLSDVVPWPMGWMTYSDNAEKYKDQLSQVIQEVLSVFKNRSDVWKDPCVFIKKYPPESFRNENPLSGKKWFFDWSPDVSFLANIAFHQKQFKTAVFYAEKGLAEWDDKNYQLMLKRIIKLAGGPARRAG